MESCKKLNLIIKTTSLCNLRCKYCYLRKEKNTDSIIDISILKKIINQLSLNSNKIDIIWHGGEPLLVGKNFFYNFVKYKNELNKKGIKINNCLQTNATLIDEEWAKLFVDGEFNIGISLDGPEKINDENRIFSDGKGSFHKIMGGIDILNKNSIKFSVLSVIAKNNYEYADKIFNFFVKNEINNFDFLPNYYHLDTRLISSLNNYCLDRYDFARFILRIFNNWIIYNDPRISIRILENIVTGLLGGTPSLCKFNNGCKDYLTIEPNGNVFPCDRFLGMEDYLFGNFQYNDLNDIFTCRKRSIFIDDIKTISSNCKDCEYYKICNGGCKYYWILRNKSNYKKDNIFCLDIQFIINEIHDILINMVSNELGIGGCSETERINFIN
jgi:uncharacterized protein